MENKKIYSYFFSPTGGTKKAANLIEENFTNVSSVDITNKKAENTFTKDDIVIITAPVFANRIPSVVFENLKDLKGNGAKMIIVATYGKVSVGDALLEMKNNFSNQGFNVIAALSVITTHSLSNKVAFNRPNKEDISLINDFLNNVKAEITKNDDIKDLQVAGNFPYAKEASMPFVPKASSACNSCKKCVNECPMKAINSENPKSTDKSKCILCMRCKSVCPQKAKDLAFFPSKILPLALSKMAKGDKLPEFFL